MTKYLISLPFIFLSIIITSCCNEDSFLIEESSPKEICLQTDEIKISEISYNDSILSNRLDQINDSVLQICNTLYKDEKPNHPQVLSLNGAEIITADAQGFYAGFKYGWSKGKTIFGKISTAAACAAIMSVVMSAAAAVVELGFGYLDYITSYNKGMPRITYSIENSYNDAKIHTYSNNLIKSNPNLTQAGTTNEFNTAVLHNLIMLDIEENRLNNVTVASDNHNESTSSSSILTEGQLRFFSTPEFIRYYNSLQNIYIGTDTFENHFISSYFTTSDIVIEKYIEGINKYNFFNAKEAHFTTQTLCNEYIKVVKGLSLDPEIKSYIISSLYIAPLSAIYWYPE